MKHPLLQLRDEIEALARRIGAPAGVLPTFGRSEDGARPHLEVHGNEVHLVVIERGQELERQRFTERDELLFAVLRGVTFAMACDWELQHRTPGEDPRRALFRRQQELLAQLDPGWGERERAAHEAILRTHPFADARAAALLGCGRGGGAGAAGAGRAAPGVREHHALLRSAAFAIVRGAAGERALHRGLDLAEWLYPRLLRQPGLAHARTPRLEGAGGCTMRVRCGRARATLTVHCFAPRQRTWYVHLEARQPWPRWGGDVRAATAANVRTALAHVLADPCIDAVRWLDRDPWAGDGEPALLDPRDVTAAPDRR